MKKIIIFMITALLGSTLYYGAEINPKKIIIYGDTRTNHEKHSELVDLIMKRQPYAVFHVGDLVESGDNPKDWEIFNSIEDKLINLVENRYYPVIGNHEESCVLYFQKFKHLENKRWYSQDIDNLHFIMLDSGEDLEAASIDKELSWIENELKTNSANGKKIIAVFHHPFFSSYSHGRNDKAPFIVKTLAMFEKYGVKLVFNGHVHYYERSLYKGINFVVTGAGGAPFASIPPKIVAKKVDPYSVLVTKEYEYCVLTFDNNKIKTEVYNINDKLIDSFESE